MHRIFSDKASLIAVFEKYSVKEALQVKHNLEQTISALNIPSPELLAQMEAEGISIEEISEDKNIYSNSMTSIGVIKSHLHNTFLDPIKLHAVLKEFNILQLIAVRDAIEDSLSFLKLPSPALMTMMEKEGLNMHKLGISSTKAPENKTEKLAGIQEKINQAMATNANAPINVEKLNQLKQKLAISAKPLNEVQLARKKAVLSCALETSEEKTEAKLNSASVVKLKRAL